MKLLVTGGSGFIGSEFIRYWLANHPDDEITNLDALTYAANQDSLKEVEGNSRYSFVKGDIRDSAVVGQLVPKANIIVHFAAESHVDRSITGPAIFVETNVLGTQVLLDAARQDNKRFHHVSTDEVFGALPLDSAQKFTEETPYEPSSPYSASKAGSDHLVRAYHETFGLPITITNCSNNYGPYQNPEKFISRMITNLIDGQNIKIYGDGKYVRDWLHVTDHVLAIEAVLQKGKIGETYLVGGVTRDINNLEVANMIIKHMFGPASSAGDPLKRIDFVKDRPGHDRRYAVDWSKINRDLGWEPEHTFEEWLAETVNWYQQNASWWRPLKEEAEALYKKTGQ